MADYALTLSDAEVARYRIMADSAERAERHLWTDAGAVPGARVADVGCGPGAVSVRLAALTAPGGEVWAVDRDPQALAIARALADKEGAAVTTVNAPATATGLPAGTFDLVMLRHVLAHNGGHEQEIVDHLAGLVRPGGSVYLTDVDAAYLRFRAPIDPAVNELHDRYREFHRRRGNDLEIGAKLDRLLTAAGLELAYFQGRIDVVNPPPGMRGPAWAARDAMVEDGLASAEDIARWDAAYNAMTGPATFFAPSFTAYARRPES
ncbi:class I SAM-dependent methyltransferase [Yinghuangia seranimata]|uniref:class I SAM-dependent methyltransferase n=1 Tax=Yinghuangia seranimata TaxID=408067 RepID=UPI00248C7986|nr:class I SAM-dependent methyltransferase [Yinghuangia seranimata]MDI2124842.1 methyltransferase domain-containing protein [Yinghuangia seranimata]